MTHYRQLGFSLTEVLISLLLLSFTLLGFEAMEMNALQRIRSAYYVHVAVEQIKNMVERLRSMNAEEDLEKMQMEWNLRNQEVLPQGKGEVSGLFPSYSIMVSWGGKEAKCEQNELGREGCLKEDIHME